MVFTLSEVLAILGFMLALIKFIFDIIRDNNKK